MNLATADQRDGVRPRHAQDIPARKRPRHNDVPQPCARVGDSPRTERVEWTGRRAERILDDERRVVFARIFRSIRLTRTNDFGNGN